MNYGALCIVLLLVILAQALWIWKQSHHIEALLHVISGLTIGAFEEALRQAQTRKQQEAARRFGRPE